MRLNIFDTGYTWNWLATLNKFIDGMSFGFGVIFATCIVILIFKLMPSVKKDDEN